MLALAFTFQMSNPTKSLPLHLEALTGGKGVRRVTISSFRVSEASRVGTKRLKGKSPVSEAHLLSYIFFRREFQVFRVVKHFLMSISS